MTRACGADDIKNILYPALFRKLRFQMIDDRVAFARQNSSLPQPTRPSRKHEPLNPKPNLPP
jgi:hypothetical protein